MMAQFERTDEWEDSPSTRIAKRIAELEGLEQPEMVQTLYDVVDPEALDELVSTTSAKQLSVEFTYYGYDVTVWGDGQVSITPSEE